MDIMKKIGQKWHSREEAGQSIVIIAGALLALLGMIGLVVDLGVVYVRDSQLRAAVDAAALAGAPELSDGGLTAADQKATQFLYANGLPTDAVLTLDSDAGQTELGSFEYTITATWTVDLFFMTLFSFDTANVTKSATGAYFPVTDIYASLRVTDGALSMMNQMIYGPDSCIGYGDPYSSIDSIYEPGTYSYRYRIYIPSDYEDNFDIDSGERPIVRVELFDPDSVNSTANSATATLSDYYKAVSGTADDSVEVDCSSNYQSDVCIAATCEWDGSDSSGYQSLCSSSALTGLDDENSTNPFWYLRVDENRGNCTSARENYDTDLNTATVYELYYFLERSDGTLEKVPLASYTGQTDNANDYDYPTSHNTDMHWVSPGAFNDVGDVPTDCGSPNGGNENADNNRCTGTSDSDTTPGSGSGFEVDLLLDTAGIAQEDESIGGARYLYIDVTSVSGSAENGYEIYAGPPDYLNNVPSEANARNLFIANERYKAAQGDASAYIRSSYGVAVYAMGNLPMNVNVSMDMDLPLLYIPASYAGREVTVSLFDPDSGTQGPVNFYFDSLATSDYQVTFDSSSQYVDGNGSFNCGSEDCNGGWIGPPGTSQDGFIITVPKYDPVLCTDPENTTPQEYCNPFYGGILTVSYLAGGNDTTVWRASLPSLPYLER